MNKKINVFSEIGPLKTVLIHRPSKEVERIEPALFEEMLFDDIMDFKIAGQEHDSFAENLRKHGAEVLYVEDLVAETFDMDIKIRKDFITEFLNESNISDDAVYKACHEFLSNIKDNKELVNRTIIGIKKNEISIDETLNPLARILEKKDGSYFYINPLPNLLFQRDPFASIFNSMNIHPMSKVARQRESLFYKYLHNHHPRFTDTPLSYNRDENASIEGGDILVISKEMIFVAVSERTTALAIEKLAKNLFEKYDNFKKIVVFDIPKAHGTMHLDTIITHIDHDTFLMDTTMYYETYTAYEVIQEDNKLKILSTEGRMKNILSKLLDRKIKIVLTGGGERLRSIREQWTDGANSLTVKPGVIVTYARNTHTNIALEKAGITVIRIPGSELSRGRGGPRCMAMPLVREDIKV